MAACLAALFALSSGSTRGAGDDAWLPISVHVALIGFDDALPVGASQLSRLLAAALPVVQPLLVETGEAFDAQYVVSYAVHHANAAQVAAVQNAVVDAANAQPQAYAAMIGGIERSVVDIDATRLNGAYTRLRDELLLGGAPVPDDDAYLVVVQRLDTAHMSPRLPAAHTRAQPTLHRFRYAGSAPAQAFVGSGRFLVVDLSAAPCRMGMLGADEGTVSADLLPALAPAPAGAPPDEVRLAGAGATRAVAALVLHAVEFVLAPSVRFCARGAGAPGRVLVPIIALRDHDAYDPLAGLGSTAGDDGGGGGAVDVEAVRAELSRWLLPEQQLEVLASTHPLHTHPALAVALARSLRSATSHELFDGSLLPVARPYADAAELLGQLRSSADVLGGELLRAGEAERAESSDAATARAATAAALRASRAHGFSGDDVGSDGDSDGVLSDKASRLLPVYVLSLSSEDSRLKLRANLVGHDHGADVTGAAASAAASAASAPSAARAHGGRSREEAGLLAVSRGAVVVLQPNTEHVPLGFFSEDGALALDGRDAQRHVIAGLLGALYGVMPPHERYAREVGRTEYSFLWAIGAHPFGPFSRAASPSAIFADVTARNRMLCQLRAVGQQLDAAEDAADRLAHDFLRAQLPRLDVASAAHRTAPHAPWAGFARRAWAHESALPETVPKACLAQLLPPLATFRAQLGALLDSAETRSASPGNISSRLSTILVAARTFARHADDEARAARAAMACCALTHAVQLPLSRGALLLLGAFGALSTGAGVLRTGRFRRARLHRG